MSKLTNFFSTTPGTKFSLVVLAIALISMKLLPASWGQENSPIEWSQVVILACAVIAAVLAAYFGVCSLHQRKLLLWSVPVWLLAIGRELSWGRVFYVNSDGSFVNLANLWYGTYVHPLIACVILITVWGLLKNGLSVEILEWYKYGTVPLIEILILVGAGMFATGVEHFSFGIFGLNEELYEELAETVCYSTLLFLLIDLGFCRRIQPSRAHNIKSYTL
ncbi:MAG: hypothetical protein H6Q69_937 [Firmicutes bacterium]|nr:hypothetical protein [Bacillota bacterium]